MSDVSLFGYALQPRYVYFPDRHGQFALACRNKTYQRACNRKQKALSTDFITAGLRWPHGKIFEEGSEVHSKNTYNLRFHLFRSTIIKLTLSFQVASPSHSVQCRFLSEPQAELYPYSRHRTALERKNVGASSTI